VILFMALLLSLPAKAQTPAQWNGITTTYQTPSATSMDVFGDSIAAGNGVSVQAQKAPYIVAASRGLTVNMHASSGTTTYSEGPVIYSLTPTTSTVSTYMIGTNETGNVTGSAQQAVYTNIIQAEYLWLLIPNTNKAFGQSLTKTGTWVNSAINPTFGISSTTNGSTATASVFGSTVYVAFWATLSNAAVVSVTVDGAEKGPITPATTWTSSDSLTTAPYAVRFAGLADTIHTVVVTLTTANSSTLNLDYIAGNTGFVNQNGPVVFAGNPDKTATNSYAQVSLIGSVMQTVSSNLSADGLAIFFADVAAWCLDACHAADGTHPDAAGQQIIANAFLAQFQQFHRFARAN
jgi:hypothetical protein